MPHEALVELACPSQFSEIIVIITLLPLIWVPLGFVTPSDGFVHRHAGLLPGKRQPEAEARISQGSCLSQQKRLSAKTTPFLSQRKASAKSKVQAESDSKAACPSQEERSREVTRAVWAMLSALSFLILFRTRRECQEHQTYPYSKVRCWVF